MRTCYDGAASSHSVSESYEEDKQSLRREPWLPFKSAEEFKVARWLIRAKALQGAIDYYFHSSLGPLHCSFCSGRTFIAKLEEMHTTIGKASWQYSEIELGAIKAHTLAGTQ